MSLLTDVAITRIANGHRAKTRRTNERRDRVLLITLALILVCQTTFSASDQEVYPRIPVLDSIDPVFSQYEDDVLSARIALAGAKTGTELPVRLFSYIVKKNDTLIGIAARCGIPYDSIASLNRIPSMQEPIAGKRILLPTLPGLYLPEKAINTLEKLLLSSFDPDDTTIITFSVRGEENRPVHCIPGISFDGTIRAFFLSPAFRFPLPEAVISSTFGLRKNPVTGNLIFHRGIDLAAPRGTLVLACEDGTVKKTGNDPVYGNFIIILHDGNRESLYGHLQTVKIELHQKVKSGYIIGTVGSTGQSTGPHLHFEIHENGVPKNPTGFIKGN